MVVQGVHNLCNFHNCRKVAVLDKPQKVEILKNGCIDLARRPYVKESFGGGWMPERNARALRL